ncbi:DUF7711 family protein [Actinokineospora cianjurensis]|uniref:DUF7711 domain-containing protein n=1 Tax=Actinokineospora cianjurensis TaxID=585224 RepID=A0A421AWU1_9PSEU|nr:hypothetical protein [Actinokineospora cianjurensis]RLK54296.1 hypothetical protein CLV68_5846 [Actinokineospora cianjurensis]
MNWTRAVHHLETLASTCADMATRPAAIFPLRVGALWVAGALLGDRREVESVTVALTVDAPEVPWLTEPQGARHWAAAARVPQMPVEVHWRSAHSPVWNHRLERPVLVWSVADGVDADVLAAITRGEAEALRPAAPTAEELDARLGAELALSLRAVRDRTGEYAERRWKPGKLEPVSDALWQASAGYLDLLDVIK